MPEPTHEADHGDADSVETERGTEHDAGDRGALADTHRGVGGDDRADGRPDEDDGLLDLHEGASEFVPVDRHRPTRPDAD